jgi:hypothetical protein
MWFPNNKPATQTATLFQEPTTEYTTTAPLGQDVVTTDFPPRDSPHRDQGCGHRVTAVIAWGKRPVPSRTRKLRPTAPMVLHPGGCGRVGHRRTYIRSRAFNHQVGGSPPLTPKHPPAPTPQGRRRPAGRRTDGARPLRAESDVKSRRNPEIFPKKRENTRNLPPRRRQAGKFSKSGLYACRVQASEIRTVQEDING